MGHAEYLLYVLAHEKQWGPILRQKVKQLEAPPYENLFPGAVVDEYKADNEFDTYDILERVAMDYLDVGSFVEYGEKALHSSLLCYSVKHLKLLSEYVYRIMRMKEAMAGDILAILEMLKNNIVLLIDKLAIKKADMDLTLQLYWKVVRLIQFDVVDNIRDNVYPEDSEARVKKLNTMFATYEETHCQKEEMKNFIQHMGLEADPFILERGVWMLTVKYDKLRDLTFKHGRWMAQFYEDLGIRSMPLKLWGQIFYFAGNQNPKQQDITDEIDKPISSTLLALPSSPIPQEEQSSSSTSPQS